MAVLPMKCRRYLSERGMAFRELQEGGQQAVILPALTLPPGHFDAMAADILILLPSGYPDCAPDMFHAIPWLRINGSGGYPRCADQPVAFEGHSWQRWSRHNTAWRRGVDGIWTMLKRVEVALAEAA